jgi:osmotically-inducible protein OsmY
MTTVSILRRVTISLALTLTFSASATINTQRTSDDAAVESSVRDRLGAQLNVMPNAIGVQAVDGVVYLHGLVDTGREKWAAAAIASQVPGVTHVVNSIEENQ